jgi:hypothetical protein
MGHPNSFAEAQAKIIKLQNAMRDYLRERDNPAPDYGYRIILEDRVRELVNEPRPKRR